MTIMNSPVPYQQVQCKDCKRKFKCTPWDDYYNNTNNEDGVCESCLMKGANITKVVTIDDYGDIVEERNLDEQG